MSATNPVPGPTISEEVWIERRLGRPGLLDGKCSPEVFRERLRAHLIERGLADGEAGKKGGVAETWRQLFARLFGEAL